MKRTYQPNNPSSGQEARLPPSHEHPRRASRAQGSPRQGSPPTVGLIWRIRERSAFARLSARRGGVSGRSAVVHVSSRPSRHRHTASCGVRHRSRSVPAVRTQPSAPPAPGDAAATHSSERRCPAGWYLIGATARPPPSGTFSTNSQFDLQLSARPGRPGVMLRLIDAYQRAFEGRPSPCRFTPSCCRVRPRGAGGPRPLPWPRGSPSGACCAAGPSVPPAATPCRSPPNRPPFAVRTP